MIRDLGVVLAAVTVWGLAEPVVTWTAGEGWVAVGIALAVCVAVCVERYRRLRADERARWERTVERWTTEETDR